MPVKPLSILGGWRPFDSPHMARHTSTEGLIEEESVGVAL